MCAYKKGENRQVLEEWFRDNAPHNFLSFRNIYALSPFGMESGARSQGGYYRQQYKCALLIGSPEPFLITLPMFLHASQASLGIEIIIDTPISA
jgi:hypothetical protein